MLIQQYNNTTIQQYNNTTIQNLLVIVCIVSDDTVVLLYRCIAVSLYRNTIIQ